VVAAFRVRVADAFAFGRSGDTVRVDDEAVPDRRVRPGGVGRPVGREPGARPAADFALPFPALACRGALTV